MKASAGSAHKSPSNLVWSGKRHLINTSELTKDEVLFILRRATYFKQQLFADKSKLPSINKEDQLSEILADKVEANLFYENSTRTRLSFELASKHLGMHVLNLDVSRSSVQKGETLEDTARTLAAMGVNVIVQRHADSGSAAQIVKATNDSVHIINAGEGKTDHPTQALLDLFTILEINASRGLQDLDGQKIVIVGDVIHSRVASANLMLMPLFGAQMHLVGPEQLMPSKSIGNITIHKDLDKAVIDADFVMAIRPQFERQESGIFGSIESYAKSFQINHERLKHAKPTVKVYAPGDRKSVV